MNNNITELVFLLDRSGSMSGLEGDTIGGFNAMLAQQKQIPGKCLVSTVLFDHERLVLHDRVPLEQITPLTQADYTVRGSTALIDAIGCAIHHIGSIHKYARAEDVPSHTMFVITTDGYENASHKFSSDEVKKMIETKKAENGWEFLFIGANIDAVETAARIGISRERAVNYHADPTGTKAVYDNIGAPIAQMRTGKAITNEWSENIHRDFFGRKKR